MTSSESIEAARRAGHRAANNGIKYAENPYGHLRQDLKLAWSQGHNEERAAMILRSEQ